MSGTVGPLDQAKLPAFRAGNRKVGQEMNRNATPEEEVYLYWFSCRVMGLAIRKGRQNFVMSALRRAYILLGRRYYERSRAEMADDIRYLGERLAKQLAASEREEDFKL